MSKTLPVPAQDRSAFTSVRLKSHFVAWAKAEAAQRGMFIYDFLEHMAHTWVSNLGGRPYQPPATKARGPRRGKK